MGSPPSIGQSGHVTPQGNGPAAPAQNHRSGSIIGRLFSRGNRSNAANRANNFVNGNAPHAGGTGQASATHAADHTGQVNRNPRRGNFITNLFRRSARPAAAAAAAPRPVSPALLKALEKHATDPDLEMVDQDVVDRLLNFADDHPTTGENTLRELNTILSQISPESARPNAIKQFSYFLEKHPGQASRCISLMSQVPQEHKLNAFLLLEYTASTGPGVIHLEHDWSRMNDSRLSTLFSDKNGNDSIDVLMKNVKAVDFIIKVLNKNGEKASYFLGDKFQSMATSLSEMNEFPSPNGISVAVLEHGFANPHVPADKKMEVKTYLDSILKSFPKLKDELKDAPSEQLAALFAPLQTKSGEEAVASFKQSYTEAKSLVEDLGKNSPDIDAKIQQTFAKDSPTEYAIFKILVSKQKQTPELTKILERNYATLMKHDGQYALIAIANKDDKAVVDLLNTDKGKAWYHGLQSSNPAAYITVTNFMIGHQSDLPSYSAELAPKVTREGNSVRVEVWREQITQGSGEFLKALNPHLSPTPESFQVIIRGEKGRDLGGLSRETTTDAYDAFIKNNFDGSGFPKWKGEEQKEEYQALGKMMAFAATRNGERPLGKKMDPKVFTAIKAIDGRSEFSMTSKLEILGKMNPEFHNDNLINDFTKFLNSNKDNEISKDNQEFLKNMADVYMYGNFDDYRKEDGSLDFKKIKDNLDIIKKDLFDDFNKQSKVDEKVMPLYYMAQGLVADPHHRGKINKMSAQELDVAIQGEVKAEDVVKALNFAPEDIPPQFFLPGNLQKAIKDWISKANNSQLENLLKVMTGSPSLGKEKELNMIAIRDKGKLDSSHTCFNRLDINVDLINNAESMKNFLDDIGDGKSEKTFNDE